jgi:hypothetical protein
MLLKHAYFYKREFYLSRVIKKSYSFLILSIFVTPHIYLNIRIYAFTSYAASPFIPHLGFPVLRFIYYDRSDDRSVVFLYT